MYTCVAFQPAPQFNKCILVGSHLIFIYRGRLPPVGEVHRSWVPGSRCSSGAKAGMFSEYPAPAGTAEFLLRSLGPQEQPVPRNVTLSGSCVCLINSSDFYFQMLLTGDVIWRCYSPRGPPGSPSPVSDGPGPGRGWRTWAFPRCRGPLG